MPRNDKHYTLELADGLADDEDIRAGFSSEGRFEGDPYDDSDVEDGDIDDSDDEEGDADDDDGTEEGDARPRASRSKKSRRRGALRSMLLPGSGAKKRRAHRKSVTGSKRLRSRKGTPLDVTRAARLKRSSNADEQKRDKAFTADLQAKKVLQRAVAPDVLYERFIGVEDRIYGDLPLDAALRPAETAAVKNAIFSNPIFAPRQFAMTPISGTAFRLYISDALAAVLPTGTEFLWAGDLIRVASSQLNAEPQEVEIRRVIGGVTTAYSYTIPVSTNLSRFTYLNGRIVAAMPRLAMAQVTSDPVPDPNNYVEVVNLDTTKYRATLRLLIPADKAVEGLLRKL